MQTARLAVLATVLVFSGLLTACEPEAVPTPAVQPTSTAVSYVTTEPAHGQTFLRCEQCRAVQVIGVESPDIVQTAEGPFRVYGAFVAPEEENCVAGAGERLSELVSSGTVRLEAGPVDTDSAGTPIRYLYTESGNSVGELFISEGYARRSSFEGQHSPWLLVTADKARRERNGCIWENFDRMFPQRTPRPSGGIN